VRSRVEIVVRAQAGASRIVRCSGGPPVSPRITGPSRVHLVGSGGGPLPGDAVDLDVTVAAGASLHLAAVAATVALPGPGTGGPPSSWRLRGRVGPGGSLVILGEPLVGAAGCHHVSHADIDLEGDARLVWREVLVPGRSHETPGDLTVGLRVTRDGTPVLEQELAVGPGVPGWDGPAVLGWARCVGSLLRAGPGAWRPARAERLGAGGWLLPLATEGAAVATVVGDAPEVTRLLGRVMPEGVA
jgi:urease accessory protein